jgi:hypothetical protein
MFPICSVRFFRVSNVRFIYRSTHRMVHQDDGYVTIVEGTPGLSVEDEVRHHIFDLLCINGNVSTILVKESN